MTELRDVQTSGLVVVDVDTLELQVRVAVVGPCRVDTVFVRDHLPELYICTPTSNKQLPNARNKEQSSL